MKEGFWYSELEPQYPKVIEGIPWEGQEEFLKALRIKERKAKLVVYWSLSICRICKEFNGNSTFYLENWEWPCGFIHYIRDHNVKPSPEFYDFVMEDKSKPSDIEWEQICRKTEETVRDFPTGDDY